jgi:serine/threonine-protein kinase
MATVWEAEDKVLTRRVAIKVLHPHLAGDDGSRVRFRREAVAAAGLAHPHIVTTYDTGRDAEVAYIVMELVEGITLARLLRAEGALPLAKALDVAAQVADALACAHAHGIVHRDVKPSNILLRADGHVKVADFGIASTGAGNEDLTRTGVVMGTAKYLSPEQVSGAPADAASDIYALGIVVYEMLCGTPPFVGDSDLTTALSRLTATPESLTERRPEVPPSLEAVVLRALARNPEARFRSAAEMRSNLLAVDLDHSEALTPPTGLPAVPPPARHFPARATTAVAAVLLLVLAAVLLKSGGSPEGGPGSEPSATARGTIAGIPMLVTAFDPEADGDENSASVGNVVDRDPATVWKTDTYHANFPSLKKGVGIYVDLGRSKTVRSVVVETPGASGWTGEVYVADRRSPTLAGWGEPAATGPGDQGSTTTFDLKGAEGRYVLVWFTSLLPSDGGFRLAVAEIMVDT